MSERKKKILKAVIDSYIETAEPVSSKSVAQNSGLGLSSATIRNEMAELLSMGYLEQPHTSAGRVPSHRGYRIYVNELMRRHKLSTFEMVEINNSLRQRIQQLDILLRDVGKLVSRLTSYPAYALSASQSTVTVRRFDFIQVDANTLIVVAMLSDDEVKNKLIRLPVPAPHETLTRLAALINANFTNILEYEITPELVLNTERAANDTMGLTSVIISFVLEILGDTRSLHTYLSGASFILDQPEYQNREDARRLIQYLSEGDELAKLPMPGNTSGVKILIGPETVTEELKNSSVVMASYDAGDNMRGLLGIVGPTRMDYAKVIARLSYIARGLENSENLEHPADEISPPRDAGGP